MRTGNYSVFLLFLLGAAAASGLPNAGDYASLQEAVDAHPGRIVFVPQETHVLSEPLRLTVDGAGLTGYGTIVQSNKEASILIVEGARGVRIRDLTFTRTEDAMTCEAAGIAIRDSHDVLVDGIRLIDNRSQPAALDIRRCTDVRVVHSEVRNYKRIGMDDRTAEGDTLYGYAFNCIDGTGIMVRDSRNISLLNNRITDYSVLPTREMKETHRLGSLTEGRYPTRPGELGKHAVRDGYVSNWHQGSAIVVTSPESTRDILISGNYIENSAQGIDLHADFVRCTDNTVKCGMMGIKLTHGSKHIVVANNLLTGIDLWAILLNPGANSHGGKSAEGETPGAPPNVDGGTVIANNIITDYGYGHEYWNWSHPPELHGSYAIALFEGQLDTNPPLRDVLITGNLVYNTGRDKVLEDGELVEQAPRYRYALYVGPWSHAADPGPTFPEGIRLHGNLFHPGTAGIANPPLAEINGDLASARETFPDD